MNAGDTKGTRVEEGGERFLFNDDTPAGAYTGIVKGFTGDKPAIFFRLPNGQFGHVCSPPHTFEEHDDGTMTVSPSILHRSGTEMADEWHGYLEKGVWREV